MPSLLFSLSFCSALESADLERADEQALVKRLIPLLCIVLKECKKKETLQMALLLLTNMSAFGPYTREVHVVLEEVVP